MIFQAVWRFRLNAHECLTICDPISERQPSILFHNRTYKPFLPMTTLIRADLIGTTFQSSIALVVLLCSGILPAFTLAQETPVTRQQELRQLREAKSKSLKPYLAGSLEAGTVYVQKERLLEQVNADVSVVGIERDW